MSSTNAGYKVVIKPGNWDFKITGKKMPGLDLERSLVDFFIAKNFASNPSGDCCTLLPKENFYSIPVTAADTQVRVNGTSLKNTAAFASNTLTVTLDKGSSIKSLLWRVFAADVQATTDGSVTNWVKIVLKNTSGNLGISTLNIPRVTKLSIPATGALSATNAANMDFDNAPLVDVIGVANGDLTLRVSGLSALPAQGYLLQISDIF